MKKKGFQGAGAVFRFSLRQQTGRLGWRLMTLLPTLILLVGTLVRWAYALSLGRVVANQIGNGIQ